MDLLVYAILQKNRKKGVKMKKYLIIILTGLCAALTLVVKIPIVGTGGYFNIGDIAVVFTGMFLGGWTGALAAGIGSAIADILAGYYIFAPFTLIAKGLFALIAGTLALKHPFWLALGGFCMTLTYFVVGVFLPGAGLQAAVSELPASLLQATLGSIGGFFVYKQVIKALSKK